MRREPNHLTRIIEPVVSGMGYECVGVELFSHEKQSVLRVFIDSEAGVLVDDCAKVSHQLSGVLDVEDPIASNYQLEVSSPGIDRPLFKLDDFDRFKGKAVEIQLVERLGGRRKYVGLLEGLRGQAVILEIGGEAREIPFHLIRKACLVAEVIEVKQGQRNAK